MRTIVLESIFSSVNSSLFLYIITSQPRTFTLSTCMQNSCINKKLYSYMMAIHHCPSQKPDADSNNVRPIRAIVGVMTSGPIYCSRKPRTPLVPITI